MIDKKTRSDIKAVKGFIEFWDRFHSIYREIISKDSISKDDEDRFLETKGMIKTKYDEMKLALDLRYAPHGRLTDPVADILTLGTIRFISENGMKKVEDDWADSYIFLNNILEILKDRKRRIERLSPMGALLKRILPAHANERVGYDDDEKRYSS